MPAATRVLPLLLRSAVYAAAVVTALLAPEPAPPRAAAIHHSAIMAPGPRRAAEPPSRPVHPAEPPTSPLRLALATVLLAGAAFELRTRRPPWR